MERMFSNAQLRRLIGPLFVEQLLVILVGMMDTVMVSSAGEAAVSGVSIVNEVNYLVITVLAALAAGGAVIVSQYLGNNDKKNADLSASQMMLIAFLVSTLLMAVCLIFCRGILMLLYGSVSSDVMDAAVTYFWITTLSFPFLAFYNCASAMYRSMNATKVTMVVSMIMNAINIAGNYVGVYLLHMGAAGVAWPTLFSRMFAALMLCILAFQQENAVSLNWQSILTWQGDVIRRILKIAVPNSIESGLFQFGRVVVTIFIATYGTSQIAANGVADSFSNLTIISSSAMQLAVVTVVGQSVGANDYIQADYYFKKMLKIAYITGAANCLLILAILPLGLKMYTLTPETAQIVLVIMIWNCIATPLLHPLSFVLPNALRASGDVKYTMIVGIISMFVIRISLAYVLGSVLHLYVLGTYFAMFTDWIVRSTCFFLRYQSGRWKNFRAI